MSQYGVCSFYYDKKFVSTTFSKTKKRSSKKNQEEQKHHSRTSNKVTRKTKNDQKSSGRLKIKSKNETTKQLWSRINKYVKNRHLKIISVESICEYYIRGRNPLEEHAD